MSYNRNLNSLAFWYPILTSISAPTPETYIIHNPSGLEIVKIIDGYPIEEIKGLQKLIDDIDHFAKIVGYPCFIRTSHTSSKHDWKDSCYLEKKEDIISHIGNLVSMSCMAGFPFDFFVVRKMIKTKSIFTAFEGMPITKEVRCTLEKDETIVRRYWPKEAFPRMKVEKELDQMYRLSEKDREFLCTFSRFMSDIFPPEWCFDLLQDENLDWHIIDMSTTNHSYINKEDNAILLKIKHDPKI